VKKFNQARVNGGSNYDSLHTKELLLLVGCSLLGVSGVWGDDANKNLLLLLLLPLEGHNSGTKVNGIG
jgi:hypothetical protein